MFATTTHQNGFLNGFFAALNDWVQKTITERQNEKLIKVTAAKLHALTDRELEDIGICRFEIDTIARAAVIK